MKKNLYSVVIVASVVLFAATGFASETSLPAVGSFKVAYYVFDSGGPDHYPLTSFTDYANVVVLFEGKLWELVDSVHYSTGVMTNVNYHSYAGIMKDVRVLQARGVKVLMNVDDAPSWSTASPFMTYDSVKYDYKQFAAFIKACAIDSLHLDGISLDIEHIATWNSSYIALLKELGKYFGPRSADSSSQMYIAAIYNSSYYGVAGTALGKSKDVASYLNFVMDMAYTNTNYASRFTQWADSIGASRTMIGVLNDNYDISRAKSAAAWQPSTPPKAGIMVYAANNLKTYTDGVFGALTSVRENAPIAKSFTLLQNFPNPFNPSTVIRYTIPATGQRSTANGNPSPASVVQLKVFDLLGREVVTLVNEVKQPGTYTVRFEGKGLASGVYVYRLTAGTFTQTKSMMLVR